MNKGTEVSVCEPKAQAAKHLVSLDSFNSWICVSSQREDVSSMAISDAKAPPTCCSVCVRGSKSEDSHVQEGEAKPAYFRQRVN